MKVFKNVFIIKQYPDGYHLMQEYYKKRTESNSWFSGISSGYPPDAYYETKEIFKTLKAAKKEKERLLIVAGRIVG